MRVFGRNETTQNMQLRDDNFLKILWGGNTHIIGIGRKESTSVMSAEQFKAGLTLFAGYGEEKCAGGVFRAIQHLVKETSHDRRRTNVLDWLLQA